MKIDTLSIEGLTPHPDNPRVHSKKQIQQIADSIQQFGFKIPILIDKDKRIICGHGRVMACQQLGMKEIPSIVADKLSDAELRAFMIADNKLTENADWDAVKLAHNFEILTDLNVDFDLEVTGFEYGDIEGLILDLKTQETEEPPLPSLINNIVTKLGDVWQLGNHMLLCGDALNPESYSRLLGSQKAHTVFTDPPYNLKPKDIGKICHQEHGAFKEGSGEMSESEFIAFLSTTFAQLVNHSHEGSIHYVCMDWRHLKEILEAGHEHYQALKNVCVWTKDKAGMGTFYRSQHELVLVFKNGNAKHQNNFQLGQFGRNRSNVWEYPTARHFTDDDGDADGKDILKLHPTIKPVKMVEDALLDCSQRHHIVLDPFLGSGTTLIAAEKTQRICYGIEYEPKYVDLAIKRWEQWTGLDAIHKQTGKTYKTLCLNTKETTNA